MSSKSIKNIIFDIGNVIVRWSPSEIIRLTFGDSPRATSLTKQIFQSTIWQAANRGELSEEQVKIALQKEFGLSSVQAEKLGYYVKHTQLELYGSVDLIKQVKESGYKVYALSDNVHEIVDYLKQQYDFWSLFDGVVISADVGFLKPSQEIYLSLLEQYHLNAESCLFIDDMAYNVEGAQNVGMSALQFENAEQCEQDLKRLGILSDEE
ncbi:HAD family hydrolase [Vibrio panuliri]|uniref:HAD family hydrolase n=1 Tax=Vibrio panuliri TaxID=1381081 RepID=A0A1Q9HQ54_9VIBR|nr:HAD family phosphatase [Vibrio panuliri]OLQ93007.1 HAD family hydrolase [Vibrio panuliri]